MKFKNLLRQIALGILVIIPGIFHSCDSIREDLKECRLLVRFKYDYNMLSTDAFHTIKWTYTCLTKRASFYSCNPRKALP